MGDIVNFYHKRLDRLRRPDLGGSTNTPNIPRLHEVPLEPLLPGSDPSVRFASEPFAPGTSALWVNGVRYWLNDDYFEMPNGEGITLNQLDASDEVVLMAK